MEKREPSYTVDGNANYVQPLLRTVWRFLKNLEIELPYDPTIPLQGTHNNMALHHTATGLVVL